MSEKDPFTEILEARFRRYRNKHKTEQQKGEKNKKGADPREERKYKILKDEYTNFINQNILNEDGALTREVYKLKRLKREISRTDYLVTLMYMGFLFTFESREEFEWSMTYRKKERIRALTHNFPLTSKQLDVISSVATLISRPHEGLSHENSLDACLEHARKWVSGSYECIFEGSITYALLRDQVRTIMESEFFTTRSPSPISSEDYQQPNYVQRTLEEWLACDTSPILEPATLTNGAKTITEYRLSFEVRTILRGILRWLENLHKNFYVCGEWGTSNVLVSGNLEVKLTDIILTHGDYSSFNGDFAKLKKVITKIIRGPSGQSGRSFPKDVALFMDLLGTRLDRATQKMLYNHSCVWAPYDVIKNVCVFKVVYDTCVGAVCKSIGTAVDKIPSEAQDNWKANIPEDTRYRELLDGNWKGKNSRAGAIAIFTFMRDAYPHAFSLNFSKQALLTTETELFALFPSFMAHFVKVTSHIEQVTDIYAKSGSDFIEVADDTW